MPTLAVDRHQNLWPDPVIKSGQFGLARVTGHVDMRLFFSNRQDVALGQLVHNHADGDLVARYLLRRENYGIACFQLHRMIALGYPRQRRACLALPAGGHDHDFMPGKTVDRVHVDRLRHVF